MNHPVPLHARLNAPLDQEHATLMTGGAFPEGDPGQGLVAVAIVEAGRGTG